MDEEKTESLNQQIRDLQEQLLETGVAAGFYKNFWQNLEELRQILVRPTQHRPLIYELRLTGLPNEHGEFFLVLKGYIDGDFVIAFHGGLGLWGTLSGALPRLRNASIEWRTDEYPSVKARKCFGHKSRKVDGD